MNTQSKNHSQLVLLLAAAIVLTFSWSFARGDDLNQPPINLFSEGLDGVNLITATVTFASSPVVVTNGIDQYFDLEFHPNLDFERVHVELPGNNYLTQTVIDTVSTIPEPATLGVVVLAGLGAMIRRRKYP